jgi:hypothetical protein
MFPKILLKILIINTQFNFFIFLLVCFLLNFLIFFQIKCPFQKRLYQLINSNDSISQSNKQKTKFPHVSMAIQS